MLQDLSSLTDQKLKQQKEAAGNSTVWTTLIVQMHEKSNSFLFASSWFVHII